MYVTHLQGRVTRESHRQATRVHEGIQFLIHAISDVRQRYIATMARHASFEFFLYCYKEIQYSEEEEEKWKEKERDAGEPMSSVQFREDSTRDQAGLVDPCHLLRHYIGIDMTCIDSYEGYTIMARGADDSHNHLERQDAVGECHECSLPDILRTIDTVSHLRLHPHAPFPENVKATNSLPPHVTPSPQTILSHCRDFEGPKQAPQKRKGRQKKHDTVRNHLGCPTTSLSFHRLYCQLSMSFMHGTPSTIMLAGPRGCGKRHIIRDVASAFGHVEVTDVLSTIESLQLDEESPTFNKDVCETLDCAFSSAMASPAPIIMLFRHIERVFITSSARDNENKMSVLARAIKPWIQNQKGKLHAGRVVIIGTTSRPDDCAGKDLEDLLEFFDDYITIPQMDHFSRMTHIQRSLETHQHHAADENPTVCHWAIQSALAWNNPNASWNEIDTATKQFSDTPGLPPAEAVSQYQTLLHHCHNSSDRQAQTAEIESWMQRILSHRIQLLHK